MGVYYPMRLGSVWRRGGLKNRSSGDSCQVYEGSGGRSVFVVYAHEILHTETAKGVRLRVYYLVRMGSVRGRGGGKA